MYQSYKKQKFLAILVGLNATILALLSALHIYWSLGGLQWYDDVLPSNTAGTQRLNPGTVSALVIALGLALMAFLAIGTLGIWDRYIRKRFCRYAVLLTGIIFLLRAVGDFKFIGFFKTITHTRFAHNDTYLFSPLCVLLAIMSFVIFYCSSQKRTNY